MQGLTRAYYSKWYGISKVIKLYRIIFIQCCTSMAWMENVYYVKINLCSTYVNGISIKFVEKYLSRNLLERYFIGEYHYRVRFYFIEYNYMFNATQEMSDWFVAMNKIKCLKIPILVRSNWKNILKQEISYLPSHFGLYLKMELIFSKRFFTVLLI